MSDIFEMLQYPLLSIISKCLDFCEKTGPFNVDDLLEEFNEFDTLFRHSALFLPDTSNHTAWILDVLQVQLERAMLDVREILNKDFATIYDAHLTRVKLHALHERVMTTFQVFSAFDVGFCNAEADTEVAVQRDSMEDLPGESTMGVVEGEHCNIANRESKEVAAEREMVEVTSGVSSKKGKEAESKMDSAEGQHGESSNAASNTCIANKSKRNIMQGEFLALSDCYPFYYFEMEVTLIQSKRHSSASEMQPSLRLVDVAIGFCSSNKSNVFDRKQAKRLGKSPGSCGYYMVQGAILYHDGRHAKSSRLSIEAINNVQQEEPVYRLGAGFHPSTRNAFFTFSGQVIRVVPANIMDYPIPVVLVPRESIQSFLVQVELQFPPRGCFSESPQPSCFDNESCNQSLLCVSSDGFVIHPPTTQENKNSTRAILADVPVPLRTNLFYFAIEVEKKKNDDGRTDIAIGFTSMDCFRNDELPGFYTNSCAYHSQGNIASILQNCTVEQAGSMRGIQAAFTSNDHDKMVKIYLGAGLHYGTNEIFFVKDGVFMGAVSNALEGNLKPVVAMSGEYSISWKSPSLFKSREQIYLRLVRSACYRSTSDTSSKFFMNSLENEGQIVYHKGMVSDFSGKQTKEYKGIASFRTFSVAPLGSAEYYYFELTVCNNEDLPKAWIAIGFSHHRMREDNKLPGGYPLSIGYHGNSGSLFCCGNSEEFGPTFGEGDIVGAGINHVTNTIFFTKNGELVGSKINTISCALFPVVGLGSVNAKAQLNFGRSPFCYKKLPPDPSELLIYFPHTGLGGAPRLFPLRKLPK